MEKGLQGTTHQSFMNTKIIPAPDRGTAGRVEDESIEIEDIADQDFVETASDFTWLQPTKAESIENVSKKLETKSSDENSLMDKGTKALNNKKRRGSGGRQPQALSKMASVD